MEWTNGNMVDGAELVRRHAPDKYPHVSKQISKYFRAMENAKRDSTKRDALDMARAAIRNALRNREA